MRKGQALRLHSGQALIETAIIAPVLIFLLIGVLEVGWALRGYLVLANANREAARFAVRPGYLDYTEAGYNRVISHAFAAISDQIEFKGAIIISAIRIDTQWVCDPKTALTCDCGQAATNPFSPTLVMTPLSVPTLTFTYPATATEQSLLDYAALADDLTRHNREFNCKLMRAGAPPSIDELVTVEMFYYQPQLLGFPLISNPLTDPVPMYAHSSFRKTITR